MKVEISTAGGLEEIDVFFNSPAYIVAAGQAKRCLMPWQLASCRSDYPFIQNVFKVIRKALVKSMATPGSL